MDLEIELQVLGILPQGYAIELPKKFKPHLQVCPDLAGQLDLVMG